MLSIRCGTGEFGFLLAAESNRAARTPGPGCTKLFDDQVPSFAGAGQPPIARRDMLIARGASVPRCGWRIAMRSA